MAVVKVKLLNSLHKKIEELGDKEGFTVEQFLASAAAEKLSAILFDEFQNKNSGRDTHAAFERLLAAVPDVEPENPDDRIN